MSWMMRAFIVVLFGFSSSLIAGVIGKGSTGGGLSVGKECPVGARTQFLVTDPQVSRGEFYAPATCVRGKWTFDQEDYNYKPTEGLAKCEEGKITWAVKFGPNGNPFDQDMICKNGKMIPYQP